MTRAALAALWLLVVVIAAQAAGGRQSSGPSVVTSPGVATRNDAGSGVVRPITAVPSEASPSGMARAAAASPLRTLAPTPPPLAAHVILRGTAAWCAPTATRCRSWGGHVLLGAVRSFRWGDRPYRVTVWSGSRHVTVTVVSFCACSGNRVIDLSPFAFSKLAPLSAGLVRVRVLR